MDGNIVLSAAKWGAQADETESYVYAIALHNLTE